MHRISGPPWRGSPSLIIWQISQLIEAADTATLRVAEADKFQAIALDPTRAYRGGLFSVTNTISKIQETGIPDEELLWFIRNYGHTG